ncbi:MAG: glycogen debranching protein GlgX [Anaerolineae bacterium]|jgi:glycogen operon protein|nr:glycogen debranching protein GlgX [Anaerolineae bacterium]
MPADDVLPGRYIPLGATVYPDGVNFCLFSKNCTMLELLLFDAPDTPRPARVIRFDPRRHRTFYYWHLFVKGLQPGQLYGYRAHGPYKPEDGHRFDGSKILLDPYARAIASGSFYDRKMATHYGVDNTRASLKSVVVDPYAYDWEDDLPLNLPYARSLIYELHVGGFTRHPSSGVPAAERGTYAGLIHKIPYLQSLGVTTVELMPIYQFDEQDAPQGMHNYWGYSPVGFFAPHLAYAADSTPLGAIAEFRAMVKALHRAGIEVVLDVVFNHTAEGNHEGPVQSFRGLENRAYYILERQRAAYANYSGCGNTVNANHSIVRRMIMDALRYWVECMHVDGFRFDLASSLARDADGQPLSNPPILWEIESEPLLAGTKLIAEAWDAGGLYQVGSFIGDRWAEWNGRFRDDVRAFLKGDQGTVSRFAARITASPDMYTPDRDPNRSINLVTCHDGFTLNDLVSYNERHNEANGENNRDGHNYNLSWNCGVEGPTDNPAVEMLRGRQIRNFLLALLLAQGTPMLLMGDEVRRTQQGNNNAYAQNNPLSWFDWSLVEQHSGLLRFVQGLAHFVQAQDYLEEEHFWPVSDRTKLTWHGTALYQPDWSDNSHSLAFTLSHPGGHLHAIFNAYWEPLIFELPPAVWQRIVDTDLPPPQDFSPPGQAPRLTGPRYTAAARSAVLLLAHNPGRPPATG